MSVLAKFLSVLLCDFLPKFLLFLLVCPLGTWARECQNGPAHIGVSQNNQLLVCPGPNGTAKLVGNIDVEGRVTATAVASTEPSERERALLEKIAIHEANLTTAFQNLTTAFQRIEQQDSLIEDMNGTISELKDALQHGAAVNGSSGKNVTYYGDLVTCDFYAHQDITHITGNLFIEACGGLTQIYYLSGLTTVGGALRISGNPALTTLQGLSRLTTVGDYLNIQGNNVLTDVNGLSSLTTVSGDYIRICNNGRLTTIPSFFTTLSAGKSSSSQCLKTGSVCC